jgi:hypothetical protein
MLFIRPKKYKNVLILQRKFLIFILSVRTKIMDEIQRNADEMLQEWNRTDLDVKSRNDLREFGALAFRNFKEDAPGIFNVRTSDKTWTRDAFDKSHTRYLRQIVKMQAIASARRLSEGVSSETKNMVCECCDAAVDPTRGSDVRHLIEREEGVNRRIAAYSLTTLPRLQKEIDPSVVAACAVADEKRLSNK